MHTTTTYMRLLLAAIAAVFMAACASMGRPEGGPRDVDPPIYVSSNPSPGELNVKRNKISVLFDENVAIEDVLNKVIISPVQKTVPTVSAAGRRVNVELRDTLMDSTTYTIDFSDAIKDLNEGNVLDGFAIDFSTGPTIDTLRISGMVLEGATLEPAQGILVGVYSNLSDTAIRTLPMERVTKTNQLGQFTLRNLREGTYRIYAVNDVNRDYHWDRSEDVAFYDVTITPSTSPTTVSDTLLTPDGRDSIVTRPSTDFHPNDVLLTWFNENYKSQYLLKNERPEPNRIAIEMAAPADSFPRLTVINGPLAGKRESEWSILNSSLTRDSLDYWITDSTLINQDSLFISIDYMRTDTLDRLSWTTDTLRLIMRGSKSARNRAKAQEKKKEQEPKKKEKEESNDSLPEAKPEIKFLNINIASGTTQDVNRPLSFKLPQPIVSFDSTAVHLEIMADTVWTVIDAPTIRNIAPNKPLDMAADYEWEPGAKYKLTIDSAAIRSIYGEWNNTITHEFSVKPMEEYSSITFNVSGISEPAIVQLLNKSDEPTAQAKVTNGRAVLEFLPTGTFYARLFVDRDSNGVYSTGILDSVQPEEVYYYPRKIDLKKNWSIEQSWNVNELPLDKQKHNDIKKNKPKKKAGEMEETEEDEEEDDYDPFDPNGYRNPFDPNAGKKNKNNLRSNNVR